MADLANNLCFGLYGLRFKSQCEKCVKHVLQLYFIRLIILRIASKAIQLLIAVSNP
jgi:hypothetical protein